MNLQQNDESPYDACPYCLTEITEVERPFNFEPKTLEPENIQHEMPELEETPFEAKPEVEETLPVEEKVEVAEAPAECAHYLGYLSEKSSQEQIPDECIMCKDIVSCMLKKMKQ